MDAETLRESAAEIESDILVVDLRRIEKIALENQKANHEFLQSLKALSPQDLDQLVSQISKEVSAQINCEKCANCCRSLTVALDYQDISTVAEGLDLSPREFREKYMKKDHEGDVVFKQRPCPLLKNNSCSVYGCRPKVCRRYPYLDEKDFLSRIGNVLSNMAVCPIVFNTVELLKLRMS